MTPYRIIAESLSRGSVATSIGLSSRQAVCLIVPNEGDSVKMLCERNLSPALQHFRKLLSAFTASCAQRTLPELWQNRLGKGLEHVSGIPGDRAKKNLPYPGCGHTLDLSEAVCCGPNDGKAFS
jgi:hypothetical protein